MYVYRVLMLILTPPHPPLPLVCASIDYFDMGITSRRGTFSLNVASATASSGDRISHSNSGTTGTPCRAAIWVWKDKGAVNLPNGTG